jgi:ribonuclease HI
MLGPEFDVSQVNEGKVLARIPTEKRNQCTADWQQVIVSGGSTLKSAQSVTGKMNWHRVIAPQLGYVMPRVYAWTTALQRILQRQSRCEAQFMKIPKNLARHIIMIAQWYQKVLTTWKATNIVHAIATGRPSRSLCLFTDANGGRQGDDAEHGGLGWHCPDLKLCGYAQFTEEILQAAFQIHTTSSTWLEWFAVAAALRHLKNRGLLDGAHVVVLADSKPMVDGMNNGSAAPHMYPFLLMVVRMCIESSARIRLTWISRESNKTADALARGQFSAELFRPGQLPRREITDCSDTLKAYVDLLA